MSKPLPNIITALDDPKLFQPAFAGPTWAGWKVVLKAAYGLALDDDELVFFKSIAGDREPPDRQCREVWICAGRGAGKDSIASVIAAYAAATFSGQNLLRGGERALVMCLACDRDQSKIVLNYVRSYFHDIPALVRLKGTDTAIGFPLKNGIDVAVSTNSFRSVRGRPIVCAILDEVAFWRDETSSKPDEEVYDAILPALARVPGSMLIAISSPYRKAGLLYRKFKQFYGEPGDILVIKAPTRVLNPTIPQEIVDRALEENFAKASAEWMAEFRSDISGYLDFEVVDACADRGVLVRPPQKQIAYRSFSDPGGGVRDSFTCAITHVEDGIVIHDCLVEIKAPFNPTAAVEIISKVLKEYGLHETTGDKYAARWVIEAFAKVGINYKHSERDRSAIYGDALPLFTSGKIRLLDNKKMINQFASLERHTSSVGKDKIDHGAGGHDDLCNAVAGAMVLAAEPTYVPPQPMFGTYGASAPSSHLGQNGGAGSNASYMAQFTGGAALPDNAAYGSSPDEFRRMLSDMSYQQERK
jgi:hypothetical protein